MGKYITNIDVWSAFGEDAFTKTRSEVLGTGDASVTVFQGANDNWISGSEAIYSNGAEISSGFTVNYDDGYISFSSAPSATVTLSADYDYGTLTNTYITNLVSRAEAELEIKTGRKFNLVTTSEYIDIEPENNKTFFLTHYPIVSLSSISTNEAVSVVESPSWELRTEGLGGDFLIDTKSDIAKIEFIDNFPKIGPQRVKASYVYGYSTIPDLVKDLNVLLVQKKMLNSGKHKAIVKGDNFSEADLMSLDKRINELIMMLRKVNISSI